MRVLVTGATGFLGFHLCTRLTELGWQTSAFHRASSRTGMLDPLGVRLIEGDFEDLKSVREAVAGQDLVIHAAADIKSWSPHPALQDRANTEATRKVAEACRLGGVGRLIHVSSVSAIGIPTTPAHPADESFKFNLKGRRFNYHLSKKKAEEAVLSQVALGLDAVIVNPGSLFGPFGATYRGAEIVYKAAQGGIVPCFAGGRCIVHVDDVVDGILAAARSGVRGERYILGGDNISFRDIAKVSARALGANPRLVPIPSVLARVLMNAAEAVAPSGSFMPRLNAVYTDGLFQYYKSYRATAAWGYAYRPFTEIADECVAHRQSRKEPEALQAAGKL
ncbi:MAG: NAD-dependent epimerase/dehydratase family protein [Terriglobia bacterium]